MAGLFLCASCEKPEDGNGGSTDSRKITITPSEVNVAYQASEFELKLDVNFQISVDTQVDWITLKESTGTKLVFAVAANEVNVERSAKIKISDKNDRYYFKVVPVKQEANPVVKVSLSIVDKDATPQTKALLANLWDIADRGYMFGHHDDLWYGRYWYNEPGNSDTKAVCGDYPGVFSVDFAEIMDNRSSSSSANAIRRRVILEARARGEVILACAHMNNPRTLGDSWDNSKCVDEILKEGSATRTRYLGWLDKCADFANELKDADGNLIPIIFRPYHEATQSWSWWGTSACTSEEFVQLWQFTVKYLRDTKKVHNFLYAVSPQMDGNYGDGARGRLLTRWPGDNFVDFIGMDCYHGTNYGAFGANIKAIEALSLEKMKPCGVTENGLESFTNNDYWTRYVLAPMKDKRVSMVVMWRNKYVSSESDKHYYSVYPGHPSEEDFRTFYKDDATFFSADLPDMYKMPVNYEIK